MQAVVPCPECGQSIVLAIGFDVPVPDPKANTVAVHVRPLDLDERAAEHRKVCPAMSGGGR